MTTFKEIRGTAVQSVSSDPSNPEVGQIWYNNSIGVLKGYALTAAAWAIKRRGCNTPLRQSAVPIKLQDSIVPR